MSLLRSIGPVCDSDASSFLGRTPGRFSLGRRRIGSDGGARRFRSGLRSRVMDCAQVRAVIAHSEAVPHLKLHYARAHQDAGQPTELRRADSVATREERRVVERIGDLDAEQDRLSLLEADRSVQG